MNTLKLFVLAVCITGSVYAQNTTSTTPSLSTLSLDEKSWIRESGFPLTTYDFQNRNINDQLNLGIKERTKGKQMTTLGWIGMGAGAVLLFVPSDGSSSGGQLKTYGSVGLSLGGIVLNLLGSKKKRNAVKKIENASYLFEQQK